MSFKMLSPDFQDQGMIPAEFTCKGEDISPGLTWQDVPAGTKSLALIMDDPDAPIGTWVHWIIFNIPGEIQGLAKNIENGEGLPADTGQGRNSWGKTRYGGPCPPSGTHRYFFRLYALDTVLQFSDPPQKADLIKAIQGHVLGQIELMGKFTH